MPGILVVVLLLFVSPLWAQGEQNDKEWKVVGKHAELNLTCRSCHFEDKPTTSATQTACIECHGLYKGKPGGEKDLAVGRRRFKVNVHDAHPGQLDCLTCHAAHKLPTLYCNNCHMFKIQPK